MTDVNHFSAFDVVKFKKVVFTESSVKELEKEIFIKCKKFIYTIKFIHLLLLKNQLLYLNKIKLFLKFQNKANKKSLLKNIEKIF